MLFWLIELVVRFSEVWLFRLVSTFYGILAALTVLYSAVFCQMWQCCLATALLWLGMLVCVWILQGLYLDSYWTHGHCYSCNNCPVFGHGGI